MKIMGENMKLGRPKNIKNKRTKTIRLTEKANYILDKLRKKDKSFDLSYFISSKLVNEFNNYFEIDWIKYKVSENQKIIDQLNKDNYSYSEIKRTIEDKQEMYLIVKNR